MSADLCCPVCSAELSIEQLFAHAETRQAFARLAAVSLPMGARLLAYVGLFAPVKNRMSIARKVKLLLEVLPDLERGQIERKGRLWAAPRPAWAAAIDRLLAGRDAGTLTLPLTSHGYLYEVLAGMTDKAEAQAERDREDERRQRGAAPAPAAAEVTALVAAALPAATPDPAAAERAAAIRKQLADERAARLARAAAASITPPEDTP